jgi:hypothetical protein
LCGGEIAYSAFTERPYTTSLLLIGTKIFITLTKDFSKSSLKGKPIGVVESIKTVDVLRR